MLEEKPKLTKERLVILASWFGVLVGVRLLLGVVLDHVWIGTLGAVAITFTIFYLAIRFSPLGRYREVINSALAIWYRRKFFYVTGAISMLLLASLLLFIDYGYANFGDRLITLDMTDDQIDRVLQLFPQDPDHSQSLIQGLSHYSALDIIELTLASADKNFHGYYAKIVSFMFAEDIEIMIFLTIFRSRKEVFAAPNVKS